MQDQMPPNDMNSMPDHGPDREGAMAKADLYKLANYSLKLFKQMQDEDQLEGWVQAKITKAADYIASVYHYMEYEMKFSEYGHHLDNSDTLSEGQRRALKGKLMEAKEKMKELKKKQATKAKGKKEKEVDENLVPVPNPSGADSAEKAKELGAKMPKPAGSEKDPISEETSSTGGTITREKGKVRHSHNPDRFTDEPHGEVASKVKAQSAADKAGEKAADKAEEKEGKNWEKRFGKDSVTRVKDGKKVSEALKGGQKKLDTDNDDDIDGKDLATLRAKKKIKEAAKPDFLDINKNGNKKEPMKKAVADKKAGPKKGVNPFAKKEVAGKKAVPKKGVNPFAKKEEKTDENLVPVPNPSGAKDAEEAKKLGAMMPAKAGEKDPIRESAELSRMKEFLTRLNG
jgi:hypothetical protein